MGFTGLFSCVKPPSKEPVPTLEFKDAPLLGKVNFGSMGSRDTAVLVFRYSDGDGDLFRESTRDNPNMVIVPYGYNADSSKFFQMGPFPITYVITEPAGDYYRGKTIHGDIYIPMGQFRESDKIKIVKFEAFVVDMKDHKSNVVVTPSLTVR